MLISLIVAASDNGVIGKSGELPWRLPADLKHFRQTTTGRHVIMGRRTYESIGRPLPGRPNIVVSRRQGYEAPGCKVVSSLQEAIDAARAAGETEAFVIGGAELYREAVTIADRVYLTRVHADVEGDTFFRFTPAGDMEEKLLFKKDADEAHAYAMSFYLYEKRRG